MFAHKQSNCISFHLERKIFNSKVANSQYFNRIPHFIYYMTREMLFVFSKKKFHQKILLSSRFPEWKENEYNRKNWYKLLRLLEFLFLYMFAALCVCVWWLSLLILGSLSLSLSTPLAQLILYFSDYRHTHYIKNSHRNFNVT